MRAGVSRASESKRADRIGRCVSAALNAVVESEDTITIDPVLAQGGQLDQDVEAVEEAATKPLGK